MAQSKLSVHAIPVHDPDAVVNFVANLQPPVVLIVNPDANFVSRCFVASPNSIFHLRNHPLSEQLGDVYNDPAGTGDRHAREMVEWCDKIYDDAAHRNPPLPMPQLDRVVLPGVNEPVVQSNEQVNAVATYNVHYLNGLTQRGRRGSCLEFSVGWPRNSGTDAPPEWEPFRIVYEACKAGNHVLSLHEYWPKEGPSMWAGWLCYRAVTWIPSYWHDVPLVFTECGLDDAALPGRAHAFWQDFYGSTPDVYVNQFAEYERNSLTLTNREGVQMMILGFCMFTADFGGREWATANIKPIYDRLVAYKRNTILPDPKPFVTHLPSIENQEKVPAQPDPQPSVPIVIDSPNMTVEGAMTWTIISMCRVFGLDPIIVTAIIHVESGGRPFVGGKPIIRNEAHILYDNMKDKALWGQHFKVNPTERWKDQFWRPNPNVDWAAIHTNQDSENTVFEFAKTLDSHAAYLSLGMGAGQIMGFNYKIPEYASPEAMYNAFADVNWGPANQVLAMFAYFYKNNMIDMIQRKDLPAIAAAYNGPGQVDYYVSRINEEIAKLK